MTVHRASELLGWICFHSSFRFVIYNIFLPVFRMASKKKIRSTQFKQEWLNVDAYKGWLTEKNGIGFCKFCNCDIKITNSGVGVIKQHQETKKHQENAQGRASFTNITAFVNKEPTVNKTAKKAMEAELRWTLHTVETSKSFNCENEVGDLFKVMFPESQAAQQFTCGRAKQTYLLQYALLPHVTTCLIERLQDKFYSISFDEADGRLAIVVRYINDDGNVSVDLLELVKLEHFDAASIVEAVVSAVRRSGLPFSKCISDETDNCSTMRGTNYYLKMLHNFIL